MDEQQGAIRQNEPLRPPRRRTHHTPNDPGPAWPSFKGQAELVGTSASVGST